MHTQQFWAVSVEKEVNYHLVIEWVIFINQSLMISILLRLALQHL